MGVGFLYAGITLLLPAGAAPGIPGMAVVRIGARASNRIRNPSGDADRPPVTNMYSNRLGGFGRSCSRLIFGHLRQIFSWPPRRCSGFS
jgi:hypothetical protein